MPSVLSPVRVLGVGLVLGGGGLRGAVFHAAALSALEIDLGGDARTADVVVGTSAGAVMGLLLRLGISATDLAAMVSDVPQHAEHELIANGTIKTLELPDQRWRTFLPSHDRCNPRLARACLERPTVRHPTRHTFRAGSGGVRK
jgi:predicted acylesterase/phospholipase RssA